MRSKATRGPRRSPGREAEIAAEKITVAKAAMLNQRAATADPQVPPSGWALHGRVYSSELAPAAGCTVFLVDPQNAFQSAYGFAYTDASGYFVLNGAATGAPAHGGAATQLYVAVADAKGEPVYRSSTDFTPNPGVATYQTHVLPAGGKPIGDPPPADSQHRAAENVRMGSVAGRAVARPRRGL